MNGVTIYLHEQGDGLGKGGYRLVRCLDGAQVLHAVLAVPLLLPDETLAIRRPIESCMGDKRATSRNRRQHSRTESGHYWRPG